jgi:hypothetical protein
LMSFSLPYIFTELGGLEEEVRDGSLRCESEEIFAG